MTAPVLPAGPVPFVTFWGAAQSVAGSMHVVEVAGRLLLLDCGLVQGRKADAVRRNNNFPFHPPHVDAVLISHAHIDHCGNVPNLVRQGFRGPVYCTPTTADLAAVMLADSAKIQEEDSAHLNIRRQYAEPWVQPLYTGADAARTQGHLRRIEYDAPVEILPGVRARFDDAGHLPGSAMIHLEIALAGRTFTLSYTGDMGRRALDVLPPPAPVPPADVVLAECTYGGRTHPPLAATLAALAEVAERVFHRRGKLLVPAFGLGRTQLVVHHLLDLMRDGRAPRMPVYVDSPLATAVADVYHRHPEAFRVDLPGDQDHVRYVGSFDESLHLRRQPGPCAIIAGGGMCEGGRIVHHLEQHLHDPDSAVVLVSFQAPRTLGRQLLDRTPTVHFLQRNWPVLAEVVHLEGFSGHADHEDLLGQLAPLATTRSRIRLVHGEPSAAEALAADLRSHGVADVSAPSPGDRQAVVSQD